MKKTDAITYFGSRIQLAEFLGIAPAAVSQWGELVPEKNAGRLERLTNGVPSNGVVLRMNLRHYLEPG